jgi:hypothetical protein
MAQVDNREKAPPITIGDLQVVLHKPTEGQVATLRRIERLLGTKDDKSIAQGCFLFLDVIDTLVTDPVVLNAVYEGMATERIKLEEYAEGLLECLRFFLPATPDEDAPRSTRRARAGASTTRGAKR